MRLSAVSLIYVVSMPYAPFKGHDKIRAFLTREVAITDQLINRVHTFPTGGFALGADIV